MQGRNLTAVVWDYDGTLVDTREKNLNVTRRLVERVAGNPASEYSVLESVSTYEAALKEVRNWREFYSGYLGLSEEKTDEAGRLWARYQQEDTTPAAFYEGIEIVLHSLGDVPHGIFSQNARGNILRALEETRMSGHFGSIIGYEEVALERQKPEPDGLLLCVEELTGMAPGVVLLIGDHEMDMRTAHNANCYFEENGIDIEVLSIGVTFGADPTAADWPMAPDFRASRPEEILAVVETFDGSPTGT